MEAFFMCVKDVSEKKKKEYHFSLKLVDHFDQPRVLQKAENKPEPEVYRLMGSMCGAIENESKVVMFPGTMVCTKHRRDGVICRSRAVMIDGTLSNPQSLG